jgi:hypothetical protein
MTRAVFWPGDGADGVPLPPRRPARPRQAETKPKPAPAREQVVIDEILAFFEALAPLAYARKTHGNRFSAGWPDIVACVRGQTFVIEAKRPGKARASAKSGGASERQRRDLDRWHEAGAIALVSDDVEEVKRIVLAHLRERRAG